MYNITSHKADFSILIHRVMLEGFYARNSEKVVLKCQIYNMTGYRADVSSLIHRAILEGSILEMDLARYVPQMSAILEGFGALGPASDNKAFFFCF